MKKKLPLLAMALLMSLTSLAQGQSIVKVQPFAFFKGQPALVGYEYAFSEKASVGVDVAPIMFGVSADGTRSGLAVGPNLRFYKNEVMDGFFFGFYTDYRTVTWNATGTALTLTGMLSEELADASFTDLDDTYTRRKSVFIVGPQLGGEQVYDSGFVIDYYFGIGFRSGGSKLYNDRTDVELETARLIVNPLHFRANISFGWQF